MSNPAAYSYEQTDAAHQTRNVVSEQSQSQSQPQQQSQQQAVPQNQQQSHQAQHSQQQQYYSPYGQRYYYDPNAAYNAQSQSQVQSQSQSQSPAYMPQTQQQGYNKKIGTGGIPMYQGYSTGTNGDLNLTTAGPNESNTNANAVTNASTSSNSNVATSGNAPANAAADNALNSGSTGSSGPTVGPNAPNAPIVQTNTHGRNGNNSIDSSSHNNNVHAQSQPQHTQIPPMMPMSHPHTVWQYPPRPMMVAAVTKPRIITTFWEDENTVCYQVEARKTTVSRREDSNFINGTKLLNVTGMTRGRRDGILKSEKTRYVVKIGAMNLKGVWIPFERAFELARNEGIADLLYPLFVKDIKSYFMNGGNVGGVSGAGGAGGASHEQQEATTAQPVAAYPYTGPAPTAGVPGINSSQSQLPPADSDQMYQQYPQYAYQYNQYAYPVNTYGYYNVAPEKKK